MPFYIVRNDITKMKTDAIVNVANPSLLGGGGVDGAIHKAAGPELLKECQKLHGCKTGEAKITKGYSLPSKYIIHTAGPVWNKGKDGEEKKLISCYENSLQLAKEYGCRSIAFPLISSGKYGYPKDKALKTAVNTIRKFLLNNDMDVYLVVFDKKSFQISQKLYADIKAYIDDIYAQDPMISRSLPNHQKDSPLKEEILEENLEQEVLWDVFLAPHHPDSSFSAPSFVLSEELEEALMHIDESFSEMLLRKIDEKGMSDVQCYKKANIDRKLFSKIRSDKMYKPSKTTVIAFALALELSLEEMQEMLAKADYSLTHSNKFDIIVEYFVKQKNYDVFEINEALFAFDQNLIRA